jgi:hypothetical protein
VSSRKSSLCRYAMAFVIIIGAALCCLSPAARAGGVSVGFGVDLGPGYGPPPPVAYQPPPVAVAPPPVVVEAAPAPAPVVVERPPQVEVYSAPVVVEQRSRVFYYYPSYHSTSSYSYSHREVTRSDYGDSSRYREDYYEY